MKIEDFEQVARLMRDRSALLDKIESVKLNGLGVTIQSHYQDDDMLRAVRPIVLFELDHRVAKIGDTLAALGVTP